MKYKTSELIGKLLDAAVAKANFCDKADEVLLVLNSGFTADGFSPSSNWAHGGPIIERERISVGAGVQDYADQWSAWMRNDDGSVKGGVLQGHTSLEAAMRAFVAAKIGEEAEL